MSKPTHDQPTFNLFYLPFGMDEALCHVVVVVVVEAWRPELTLEWNLATLP